MKTVQHTVRWEGWLSNAIQAWCKENGDKTFSQAVNYLISNELGRWGYTREYYEPGISKVPSSEPLIKAGVVKIVDNNGKMGDVKLGDVSVNTGIVKGKKHK
jgi:hypothetical protein